MATKKTKATAEITPFAHPFYTNAPVSKRHKTASGHRMLDWISQGFGPIPKPKSTPLMNLNQVVGAPAVAAIQTAGAMRFHAFGDTGRPDVHNANQESVAQQMAADFSPDGGAGNPAFCLHLGDVIYGPGKDELYRDEFYRAYMNYPGKILAVPGNHDGEIFKATDPVPLKAFLANFCAANAVVPPVASQVRIFRQTMTQPGVYFLLSCPFIDIVCLYSNIAEGPGSIIGANNDQQQKIWLLQTLKTIAQARKKGPRKALIFAVHHPLFSNGGHSGSAAMLADFDDVCKQAGIEPDAMLSGHAHNYQRHTRAGQPFLVAGTGGHNDSAVGEATGQLVNGVSFDKSKKGFGYLLVTASAAKLQIDFFSTTDVGKELFDSVTVVLK